jgi:hypothetical protein
MVLYTVKADEPELELEETAQKVAQVGFCWWGFLRPQRASDAYLVIGKGKGAVAKGASGILHVSEVLEKKSIPPAELKNGTPARWIDKGELDACVMFAKVIRVQQQHFPPSKIFVCSQNSTPTSAWYANMEVRILDD